jgi:drug/metabolite transporter (DMT)-like permease
VDPYHPRVTRTQLLIYVSLALIWGSSFLLLLFVVLAFGWAGAVTFRSFLVAGLILVAAVAMRRRLVFTGHWRPLAVVGATTVAGQLVGLSIATPRIGTQMAAILVATIPLFSLLIGQVLRVEHVPRPARFGLVLGFGGIVLLVGFPPVPFTLDFALGCACSLLSAASAAFGSNWARARLGGVGAWEQTAGAFLVGGLLTLPLLLVVPVPGMISALDMLALLLLAAVHSALAYTLYFRLVREVGATVAISVEFVVPVVAVAIGFAFLGERLTVPQLVGGAVIITGCLLVVGLLPVPGRRKVLA